MVEENNQLDTQTDREEIIILKHKYCWAIDNADADAFVNLFTDDASFIGEEYSNDEPHINLEGSDDILDWIQTSPRILRENVLLHQHRVHNPVIQIKGEKATGKWYFTSISAYQDRSTEIGLGTYENEYRKENGDWKYSLLHGKRLHTFKLPSETGVSE